MSPETTVRRVQRLTADLRDRIAAGEVVQRPASALKELLENALDAGADHIEVRVEDAANQLLEVADNGKGIDPEDLTLAVENHATSKVLEADDLEAIYTFGFRGEALASMRSAGKLTLTSRTGSADTAWELRTEPDHPIPAARPASRDTGTTVRLEKLFDHWPARKKFLRSPRAELLSLREVVDQYLLAHPQLHLQYWIDGKSSVNAVPASRSIRVAQWLGDIPETEIMDIREAGPLFSLQYIGALPRHQRSRSSRLAIFVNHRPVQDKSLLHAIVEGQRRWLSQGSFPMGVLYLDVDPSWLDVNVHPAKTEVRFTDARLLHEFVRKTLQHHVGQMASGILPSDSESPDDAHGEPSRPDFSAPGSHAPIHSHARSSASSYGYSGANRPTTSARAVLAVADTMRQYRESSPATRELQTAMPTTAPPPVTIVGQVAATYIVAKTDEQILIVDQHAAHEALNYERIRASLVDDEKAPSQQLLLPVDLVLPATHVAALQTRVAAAEKLGFRLDFPTEETVQIAGIPHWQSVDTEGFIADWAHALVEEETAPTEAPRGELEVFTAMRACKSSIRANTRLPEAAMQALVEDVLKLPEAAACPHGRPTCVTLSAAQLDKLFLRTV